MRANTFRERHRLYLLARVVVSRQHRRSDLTLATVARALGCSSRQLQRAYAQFGDCGFHEELVARRMAAAAQLLGEHELPIGEVMRRVGYRHPAHFAASFRRRYGLSPARFRERARGARAPAATATTTVAGGR
ncbi:MAG TPA: helix-turn-helix transcriptional regulator [Solirubrobacteraceae bacterium]